MSGILHLKDQKIDRTDCQQGLMKIARANGVGLGPAVPRRAVTIAQVSNRFAAAFALKSSRRRPPDRRRRAVAPSQGLGPLDQFGLGWCSLWQTPKQMMPANAASAN